MTIPAQAFQIDRAAAKAAGYTDAEIDAFMASGGRETPRAAAPADATAGLNPADYDAFSAKFGNVQPLNPVSGALRSALAGRTLGLSERPVAAARALLAGPTSLADFGQKYDSTRAVGEQEMARFRSEMPLLALGSELTGGAKTPWKMAERTNIAGNLAGGLSRGADKLIKSNNVLARTAKGAGVGSVMGGAAGIGYQGGEADKSMEQTIANALFGAKVGGAVGGAIPVVTGAAGLAADLSGARNMAKPTQLGTVPVQRGRGTANPLDPAFWSTANAKDVLMRGEGMLFPMQAERLVDKRMMNTLTEDGATNLRSAADDFDALNALTGNAMVLDVTGNEGLRLARGARGYGRNAGRTFNDAFDARTATLAPNMEDDVANTLAARENVPRGIQARRDVRSQNARAAYGPVMGDPVPLSDDMKTVMLNDPQGIYQRAHEAGSVTRLREMPGRKIKPLFGQVDDGNGNMIPGLLREPTVEDIDMMKKGLDVVVNDRNASTAANTRYDAKLIRNQLDQLLGEADAASPGYGAARRQFGDDSEMIEAFEGMAQGVNTPFRSSPKFSQATPDQVEDFFSRLSAAGRSEGQRGLAQDMYRMIDTNASRALNDAASPVRSGLRRKLDIAFSDKPDAARELTTKWNARDVQQKNQQFVTGGSPTAEKLLDQVEAASLPGRVGQITYAPERMLAALLGEANVRRLGRNMSDQLAQRMTLGGPEGAEYLRRYLPEFENALATRSAGRRAMTGRGIGAGIGARDAIRALFGGSEDH